MVTNTQNAILLGVCCLLGLDAASIQARDVVGMALLDTVNNLCLSDYADDYQLYSAIGNSPNTFSMTGSELSLLGKTTSAVCDVAQGHQLECNMPPGSGSTFSVSSANVLSYAMIEGTSSVFYGCTNTNPPSGGPSTNYFTQVAASSPNCRATTLKFVPAASCPSLTERALKDSSTGICLSSYSAAHAIYAAKGSPIDKFTLKDSMLTMNAGNGWSPLCVTSESGGYSKQFQCSNDVDYDGVGNKMTSSFTYTTVTENGATNLAYYNQDGSYSTSFYGCGWDSAVYFAVEGNPESSPGICHAAKLSFVDESACYQTAVTTAVSVTTLEAVANSTIAEADSQGLNDV